MRTYLGMYDHARSEGSVFVEDTEAGVVRGPLPMYLDVRNHSPTGFAWGYGGSGPAQLALAICIDVLDGDVARAVRIYHAFKWHIIARLPMEGGWVITRDKVLKSIEDLEEAARTRGEVPSF